MNYQHLPNGDLEVSLEDSDDREDIAEWRGNRWWELFGDSGLGLIGNGWGRWGIVKPEWIGALTDAPIVTDDYLVEDDGTHDVCGNVWWFPNYAVEDPIETLLEKGRVVFKFARRAHE